MNNKKVFVITGCSTKTSLAYKIAKQLKEYFFYMKDKCTIVAIANPNDWVPSIKTENGGAVDEMFLIDFNTKLYKTKLFNIIKKHPQIDCLINCAGISENCWFEDMQEDSWDSVMNVNLKSYYQTIHTFLPALSNSKGTVLNIVSNAAHIPMRTSTAYNISKAGALMLTQQLARELTQKFSITIFSISPNKLDGTNMSFEVDSKIPKLRGWSEEQAEQYQLSGLVTGKKTDPDQLAEFIAFLLSKKERHFYLSGCDIPYGA